MMTIAERQLAMAEYYMYGVWIKLWVSIGFLALDFLLIMICFLMARIHRRRGYVDYGGHYVCAFIFSLIALVILGFVLSYGIEIIKYNKSPAMYYHMNRYDIGNSIYF